MELSDVIEILEAARDPQIQAIYQRRNPGASVWGVRFGDLYKLEKKIKRDSALARQLWQVDAFEPKWLACRAMDPADLTEAEIDTWVNEIEWSILSDELANLVYRTSFAEKKRKAWTKSKQEYVRRAGFTLVYNYAADPNSNISDQDLRGYLTQIGNEIQESPNWSREMMNMVPIAIGMRNPALKEAAIEVCTAYGKVDVFHGDKTDCKVWDAVEALNNPRTKVKPPV